MICYRLSIKVISHFECERHRGGGYAAFVWSCCSRWQRWALVRALAKAIQMAWWRSRRSPELGGMMVAGVMVAVWVVVMSPTES